MTLASKILWASSIQYVVHYLYIALCVYLPWSNPLCHHVLDPFTLYSPTAPFLLVTTVLFVSVSLFSLFVYLLLSASYPTFEWSHMVLFLSDLPLLAWYSQDPSVVSQVAVFHLTAEWYVIVCMHHTCFQSSVNAHIGCFHVLATVNSASVNRGVVHLHIWMFSDSSGRQPGDPHQNSSGWLAALGLRLLTHPGPDLGCVSQPFLSLSVGNIKQG